MSGDLQAIDKLGGITTEAAGRISYRIRGWRVPPIEWVPSTGRRLLVRLRDLGLVKQRRRDGLWVRIASAGAARRCSRHSFRIAAASASSSRSTSERSTISRSAATFVIEHGRRFGPLTAAGLRDSIRCYKGELASEGAE